MKSVRSFNNEYKEHARTVLRETAKGIMVIADELPENFNEIITAILNLKGKLVLSGMGKSGYIAHKIAASFSSTGTPSFYIHPGEASHGDLGMITKDDMAMVLSNSGNTRELYDLIHYCKSLNVPIIGMTMGSTSHLARNSDYLLLLPQYDEASTTLNAPTTSCSMMLALGDALMTVTHELKGFTKAVFATVHPGGAIGAATKHISAFLHVGKEVPYVNQGKLMADVIDVMSDKKLGLCAIIGDDNRILGIIDDDIIRKRVSESVPFSELPVDQVMSKDFKSVSSTSLAKEAMQIMVDGKLSSLFVSDEGILKGIVFLHDFI